MRLVFRIAATSCILSSLTVLPAVTQENAPAHGDGIFTPIVEHMARIDKTDHPVTDEISQPEPGLSGIMAAGMPTGGNYMTKVPTGDAGGACVYTGMGRYNIDSNGTLNFQMIADCGQLKQAYSFMVCKLDADLKCTEAPWWYFKNSTYTVTDQGVSVSGKAAYPWNADSLKSQKPQKIAADIAALNARVKAASQPNVVHTRLVSCREFHPEARTYTIHEIASSCLFKTMCGKTGIPGIESLKDGQTIDWASLTGQYVKQTKKIPDTSNWECWARTQ